MRLQQASEVSCGAFATRPPESTDREQRRIRRLSTAIVRRQNYSDKPLCTTLPEADRIFSAFETARRPVAFAYGTELRWDRGFQSLREVRTTIVYY